MEYKSGYVAVIGKPNAGKSTLINAIIGEKVAIVSPKPQTTRNNILGIKNAEDYQIIFIDTPGIHSSKNGLDKFMMKNVRTAIAGANIIIYLLDGTHKFFDEEFEYIEKLADEQEVPVIVAITKIDLVNYDKVYPLIDRLMKLKKVKEIIPLSSLKSQNIDVLTGAVLKFLPVSNEKNFEFENDLYTDKSIKFLTSEIVREKLLLSLDKEIPHGIAIEVVKFEEDKNLTNIDIDIICEKDSHKGIIIGKQGLLLKKIGESSRLEIEKLLDCRVMLKLFVKVKKNWRDDRNLLNDFGYNDNNV